MIRFVTEETSQHGEVSTRSVVISSSFTAEIIKARAADDWLVLGRFDDAPMVLERWLATAPRGSLVAVRPASTAPIGTSVPGSIPTTVQIQGGTYIPPEQRTAQRPERRVRLHTFAEDVHVRAFDVDPDGRFVLYVTSEPAAIYQLPMVGGAQPILLFDDTQIPRLHKSMNIQALQHVTYGRVYSLNYVSHVPPVDRTTLIDANNDGIFEQVLHFTRAEYETQFGEAFIVDSYVNF